MNRLRWLVLLGLCLQAQAAVLPERSKHAIAWTLSGSAFVVNADTREYRFTGPLHTTRTSPENGAWQATQRQLGNVSSLTLVRHDSPATDSSLAISDLQFLWRGTHFTATQAGERYGLPFDGRLLLSLGAIGSGSRYRITGCLGVIGDAAGDLAGRRGSLCLSGSLKDLASTHRAQLDSLSTLVLQ